MVVMSVVEFSLLTKNVVGQNWRLKKEEKRLDDSVKIPFDQIITMKGDKITIKTRIKMRMTNFCELNINGIKLQEEEKEYYSQ